MSEDSPETARAKATRIWRNNWIQRQSELQNQEETIDIQVEIDRQKSLDQGRRKLITAITKVIMEQKTSFSLVYYKSAINRRKRRLLEEKLRRLESKHGE